MTLVADDGNNTSDVFVRDVTVQATERASLSDGGGQLTLAGRRPDVSADGTRVAFETTQDDVADPSLSNLGVQDVLVRDRAAGKTLLASVAPPGTDAIDADAELPLLNGSGRFVAFRTRSAVLDPADDGATQDIYAKELGAGTETEQGRRQPAVHRRRRRADGDRLEEAEARALRPRADRGGTDAHRDVPRTLTRPNAPRATGPASPGR